MLFQTDVSVFFLMLNTKEDILKSAGNQTNDGPRSIIYPWKSMGINNCLVLQFGSSNSIVFNTS